MSPNVFHRINKLAAWNLTSPMNNQQINLNALHLHEFVFTSWHYELSKKLYEYSISRLTARITKSQVHFKVKEITYTQENVASYQYTKV